MRLSLNQRMETVMALRIERRAVARASFEHSERLGAFNGFHICQYHYPDGECCPIGLVDGDFILKKTGWNRAPLKWLTDNNIVECDDEDFPHLRFIQRSHDAIVANMAGIGRLGGEEYRGILQSGSIFIPPSCRCFVETVKELNRDTWCELMLRIRDG